jgi:hypothetical protein
MICGTLRGGFDRTASNNARRTCVLQIIAQHFGLEQQKSFAVLLNGAFSRSPAN